MRSTVVLLPQKIDSVVCDQIIKSVDQINEESLYDKENGEITTIHKDEDLYINLDDSIIHFLFKNVLLTNQTNFGFDISYGVSQLMCHVVTVEKQQYNQRKTNLQSKSFTDSKLTCLIQLSSNDYYDGGSLEILDLNNSEFNSWNQKGSVLLFPSFLQFKINNVIGGKMYYISTSFDGPLWK